MSEDAAVKFDGAPVREPDPEMTGIGSVDVESVREWMFRWDRWEVAHPECDG
jgi:hypothetical protein